MFAQSILQVILNEGDGLKMRVDFSPTEHWEEPLVHDDKVSNIDSHMKGSIVIDVIVEAIFILGKYANQ